MKPLNLKVLYLIFLLGIFSLSCKKRSDVKDASVFVAGTEIVGGNHVGKIWANNAPQTVTDPTSDVEFYSIAVSEGNDIYAVGSLSRPGIDSAKGILWINGVTQTLGAPSSRVINTLFIAGNDIYVAENSYIDSLANGRIYSTGSAYIFKNGVAQFQIDSAEVSSIFVSGPDVYAAGTTAEPGIYGYRTATVWKNRVPQYLTSRAGYSQAHSIFVSGSDVYAVGEDLGNVHPMVVTLWKNGVPQYYSPANDGTGMGLSVFVDGSDVFVAGTEDSQAVIWKNGVKEVLPGNANPSAAASSVFVKNGDVYVAGYVSTGVVNGSFIDRAVIWKNGVIQYLTDGTNSAFASSIFVK